MSDLEILSLINENIHRKDFTTYMDSCIKKWQKVDIQLQAVNTVISSVCKQWNISKDELIEEKKFAEPRAVMYYIMKKQMNLSYSQIASFFNKKGKGYIHKVVDDMTFVVEHHNHKDICEKVTIIEKDIANSSPKR